ncbi:hypothetical protein V496_06491 [Pseudogymnoascus sp. VKM F-4515 (FW-2607)]|nr:hypothetical protein V496_06491 [Pseudogymnoascus sp. VKM F-4515 (FW-2607)]
MHASTYLALQAVTGLGTFPSVFAKNVILPIPGGALQLGTTTAVLTDHSRPSWINDTSPRALPISVFYPVGYAPCSGGYLSEYVPQIVSDFENKYFELYGVLAEIDYAAFKSQMYHTCSGGKNNNGYPLLIFSPGYERTRLLYGALAQAVAKAGYVVVTIDHPYDADIIQYPSGKVITTAHETNLTDAELVAVRVEDVSFILDQLSDKKIARKLVPYNIDTSKVGMYGHSAGGAAAANALIFELDSSVALTLTDQSSSPLLSSEMTNLSSSLVKKGIHTSAMTALTRPGHYSVHGMKSYRLMARPTRRLVISRFWFTSRDWEIRGMRARL